ncbi:hypothetical protein PYCC9005_005088 [Savitreella phatthalungensis]
MFFGANVFKLCRNLGYDEKYGIPLFAARSLSTYAALVWLPRLLWDSRYLLDIEAYRNPEYPWQPAAALLWCCVASYLSFSVTDGLMLRWMFNYGPRACLVRLLTLDAFNYYITHFMIGTAKRFNLLLPAWILISCLLTMAYIIQDWLTSHIARQRPRRRLSGAERSARDEPDHELEDEEHDRFVNLLEVCIFCVVPVGFASFVTMCLSLFFGRCPA